MKALDITSHFTMLPTAVLKMSTSPLLYRWYYFVIGLVCCSFQNLVFAENIQTTSGISLSSDHNDDSYDVGSGWQGRSFQYDYSESFQEPDEEQFTIIPPVFNRVINVPPVSISFKTAIENTTDIIIVTPPHSYPSQTHCKNVVRMTNAKCSYIFWNYGELDVILMLRALPDFGQRYVTAESIDNVDAINNTYVVSSNGCLDWSVKGNCPDTKAYHRFKFCFPGFGEAIPYWNPFHIPTGMVFHCVLSCMRNCTCVLRDGIWENFCDNETSYSTLILWGENKDVFRIDFDGDTEKLGRNAFFGYPHRSLVKQLTLRTSSYRSLRFIETGAFHGMHNLNNLELNYNYIQELQTGTFESLVNLQDLHLDWNSITTMDPDIFHDQLNLRALYLDYNQINNLPLGLFSCLSLLVKLKLNNNHLHWLEPGVFLGMPRVESLDLSNNFIRDLDSHTFNGLINLHVLDFTGNALIRISPLAFVTNGEVTNYIERVDSSGNPCISKLNYFSDNDTTSASKKGPLQQIHLTKNNITKFSFQSFTGLENVSIEVDHDWLCCFLKQSHCVVPVRERKTNSFLTCNRLLPNKIASALLFLFGCFAIIGNMSVIIWQLLAKSHKKVQPLLITNLAISDFLMGIYMLLIASADVHFGDYFPAKTEAWRNTKTCLATSTLSMVSSEASIMMVTLISLDRLMGIRFTFSNYRLHIKQTLIAVILIWAVSLTLSLIPVFAKSNLIYELSEVCMALPLSKKVTYRVIGPFGVSGRPITYEYGVDKTGMHYSTAVFIGFNSLCCLIIAVCYIWIFITATLTARRSGRQVETKDEIHMALKMFFIVMTDFCCWVPVIIMGILVQKDVQEIPPVANAWITTILMPINAAVNPFLYTLTTILVDKYKKARTKFVMKHDWSTNLATESTNRLKLNYSLSIIGCVLK